MQKENSVTARIQVNDIQKKNIPTRVSLKTLSGYVIESGIFRANDFGIIEKTFQIRPDLDAYTVTIEQENDKQWDMITENRID